ncbi:MAG: beta-glucosidase [Acidimicrobiia bacterium]|nr:beta-glucosidase [Acidimicrobiia bacterium]
MDLSDFVWGAATSAYQIEGGRLEGGKGESIWDRFADIGRMPESGDVACDHYNRWEEDVALMADLGLDGYRFSIAWTRVLPDGRGKVNQEGLDFYDRLVDGLLAAGITPYPTLYHWDLPQTLEDDGGWTNRATVDAFVEYTESVVARLGDRVKHWITHNEPWVATFLGHLDGVFAPGRASWDEALAAGHHILLSHGRAVPVLRDGGAEKVGIALDCRAVYPASGSAEDVAACRHFDGFRNRWFYDPVFGKGYPQDMLEAYRARGRFEGATIPANQPGDLDEIAVPIDFLGLNYYTSIPISAARGDETEDTGVPAGPNPPDGHTEMGWPITPNALTEFLERINNEWEPESIYITENGASYSTGVDEGGRVRDQERIEYLDSHIAAVAAARERGVPVDGYFVWSLLDNLEWVEGYRQRFGIIHVDHATGTRTPKDSYYWYRNRINDGMAG